MKVKKEKFRGIQAEAGGFPQRTTAASSRGTNMQQLHSNHGKADTKIVLHAKALKM